jgi:hypothetical protein
MTAKEAPKSAAGRCLCGAIRFSVQFPTKWCAHCHCSMCRLAHGAPFVTFVGVVNANFRIESGAESIERYASSATAVRSFCRHCGTTFLFQASRWPGEVHVARACIKGAIDREPESHAFFDDRVEWIHVNDDLPKLGGTSGTEPKKAKA